MYLFCKIEFYVCEETGDYRAEGRYLILVRVTASPAATRLAPKSHTFAVQSLFNCKQKC